MMALSTRLDHSLGLQRKSGLRNQEQYLLTATVMHLVLLVEMLLNTARF